MGKYETYTAQAEQQGSETPNVDALAKMMSETFENHICHLSQAVAAGVRVIPSERLQNTDVMLMVSPAAFEALKKRCPTDEGISE